MSPFEKKLHFSVKYGMITSYSLTEEGISASIGKYTIP